MRSARGRAPVDSRPPRGARRGTRIRARGPARTGLGERSSSSMMRIAAAGSARRGRAAPRARGKLRRERGRRLDGRGRAEGPPRRLDDPRGRLGLRRRAGARVPDGDDERERAALAHRAAPHGDLRPAAAPDRARWTARARCRRTSGWSSPSACRNASKMSSCCSGGDADAGVPHREAHAPLLRGEHAEGHLALLGELEGVGEQVLEDLLQALAIRLERTRGVGLDADVEARAAVCWPAARRSAQRRPRGG